MRTYSGRGTVNIGTGRELSIRELAELTARTVGYTGRIRWDSSKPDGTPRKLLDLAKIRALGWTSRIPLEEGIRLAYQDYLSRLDQKP